MSCASAAVSLMCPLFDSSTVPPEWRVGITDICSGGADFPLNIHVQWDDQRAGQFSAEAVLLKGEHQSVLCSYVHCLPAVCFHHLGTHANTHLECPARTTEDSSPWYEVKLTSFSPS